MESALFRCDAGAKHGLGHLSRCLTLAGALAKQGVKSRFAINAPDSLADRIIAAGHEVARVGVPLGPLDDPGEWPASGVGLLILDSKGITQDCAAACKAIAPVVCFDDEVARDLPCDVLINNNPWACADDYGQRAGRKLLLGPKFNTVRAEFFAPPSERHGLLITLGGEDPDNHTTWLIEQLVADIGHLPTVIVIGPAHPDPESVQNVCKTMLPHAEVNFAPATLAPLVLRCHIAISAAGTTCYELAAGGVAMAVLAVEEHQARLADTMVSKGAALSLGRYNDIEKEKVRKTYADLVRPQTAASLAMAGRSLFPRPGIDAIVFELRDFLKLQASAYDYTTS